MPDLPSRDQHEADLAMRIAKLLQRQLGTVMETMGDPPDVSKLTPEFWQQLEQETAEVIRPQIEGVFLESAEQLMNSQPIGIEWGGINQRAAEWSSQYTFDLVSGVNQTTQGLLQTKIRQFYDEPGTTLGTLKKELQSAFGPVRAEMIAVTETTRAAAQGQLQLAEEINRDVGVKMVAVWDTAMDDRVCPICGPLHGRAQGDGWTDPPPAHVRCRCSIGMEFPADG
jgi:SPP1 gp7 family putative phage head morphogenesis protein